MPAEQGSDSKPILGLLARLHRESPRILSRVRAGAGIFFLNLFNECIFFTLYP